MELWTVIMKDFGNGTEDSKPYKTKEEATAKVQELMQPLLDDGFKKILKNNGSVIELVNDEWKFEISICHTSKFETAPEIVVNAYEYSERYILEVMHDFGNNTAGLYVYDRENPDMKIAISHYDLAKSPISDSEIMAIAAPDLDDSLASLALLNSLA